MALLQVSHMVVAGFGGSVGTGGFVVGGSGKKTRTVLHLLHMSNNTTYHHHLLW